MNYGKRSDRILKEYVEQFGVNVKKLDIYLFFLLSSLINTEISSQLLLVSGTVAEYSIVEIVASN